MRRTNQAALLLIAIFLFLISSRQIAAQVRMPAGASLDIQIPVAPIPVRINGKRHLAYELHITNFRTFDLALARVEVFNGDRTAVPLADYQDKELSDSLARPGARSDLPDKRIIGGGMRAVVHIWLALHEAASLPSTLQHRISFNLLRPTGSENGVIENVRINVRNQTPLVLNPPVRGGRWVAVYDPALAGGHRRAFYAINGAARIPARFAIDWVRLGDDGKLARGDSSKISNWYGYGAEVLAVADAKVVDAKNDFPENASLADAQPIPLTIENASGNYVTLDLGNGRFAFYEHLQPGSVRVRVGDRVRRGQVIGLLGNTGSSSLGPHLHFHIGNAGSPLAAEGLPYVFRNFEVLGAVETLDRNMQWASPTGAEAIRRRMEMPFKYTVLRLP